MTNKLEELKKEMEEAEVAFDACNAAHVAYTASYDASYDAAYDAALDAYAAYKAAKEAYYQELNKNKNNE